MLLGEKTSAIRHTKKTSFPSVRGTPNCAFSSLKKFINICKLSEVISLKLFHKPWDEIDRTLLRSKGSCYLLVITHETLLEVSPRNPHWLLLVLEGGGGGQKLSVRQDSVGVK